MAGERLTLWTSAAAAVATLGAVAIASFVIWNVTAKERAQFTSQVAALNAQVGALNDKVEKTNVTVADIKKLASLGDTTKELDRLNSQIGKTNERLGAIQKDTSLDGVKAALADLNDKFAAVNKTLDGIKAERVAIANSAAIGKQAAVASKPNDRAANPDLVVVYVPQRTMQNGDNSKQQADATDTTSGIPVAPLSVRFDKIGSANVGGQAEALVGNLKRIVKDRHDCTISVAGYADTLGSDAVNLDVSRERAEAVAAKLRAAFAGENVAIKEVAWGERQLKVWTPDGKSEMANRRVDISVDCKG
jgi:outer membrane protein OmpA-like peptidoglycan-associated protein